MHASIIDSCDTSSLIDCALDVAGALVVVLLELLELETVGLLEVLVEATVRSAARSSASMSSKSSSVCAAAPICSPFLLPFLFFFGILGEIVTLL
jgi:hypothetical protein